MIMLKKKSESMNPVPKCIYTSSHPVAVNIPLEKEIFVLEMNNETNRIMGIGRIFNVPIYNKYKIYNENKFNVFSCIGTSRIDRTEMQDLEEDIMRVFDILCFKGKRNLKRLEGIKRFAAHCTVYVVRTYPAKTSTNLGEMVRYFVTITPTALSLPPVHSFRMTSGMGLQRCIRTSLRHASSRSVRIPRFFHSSGWTIKLCDLHRPATPCSRGESIAFRLHPVL